MLMERLLILIKLKLQDQYDFKNKCKEIKMNNFKINLVSISLNLIILFTINLSADALKDSYSLEYKGDYEGSLKLMESLISEKPNEYLYQYRAGWVSYMAGKFSQSVSHYSKAVVSEQSSLEPRVGQIKPLLALGKFREVEAVCKSIIQLDSKNYTARTTLAYALYVSGDFQSALKYYLDVLKEYPTDLEMLLGVGWSNFKLGKKDKAYEAFQKAERINPWNERVLEGLRYTK